MQELNLQLQNLKRSDKYCLLLLASLLICMAMKMLVFDQLQYKTELTKSILREEQQRLDNYLAFAGLGNSDDINNNAAAEKLAYKMLPQEITAAENIRYYTALAEKHNLQVQSIRPVIAAKESKNTYGALTFKVVLKGDFYKAAAFLEDMQSAGRVITIKNIVMERSSSGLQGDILLSADFTAYALE